MIKFNLHSSVFSYKDSCPGLKENFLNLKYLSLTPVIPNLFGARDQFHGRWFFHGRSEGDGFWMIQAHYIYYAATDLICMYGPSFCIIWALSEVSCLFKIQRSFSFYWLVCISPQRFLLWELLLDSYLNLCRWGRLRSTTFQLQINEL